MAGRFAQPDVGLRLTRVRHNASDTPGHSVYRVCSGVRCGSTCVILDNHYTQQSTNSDKLQQAMCDSIQDRWIAYTMIDLST